MRGGHPACVDQLRHMPHLSLDVRELHQQQVLQLLKKQPRRLEAGPRLPVALKLSNVHGAPRFEPNHVAVLRSSKVHVVWPDVLQQGSAWHVAVALQRTVEANARRNVRQRGGAKIKAGRS